MYYSLQKKSFQQQIILTFFTEHMVYNSTGVAIDIAISQSSSIL